MDATRDETAAEPFDRNWLDLMQELRVPQTGVQLFGLAALGLTLVAVADLIFSVVLGTVPGVVTGVAVLVLCALVWVELPMSLLRQAGRS